MVSLCSLKNRSFLGFLDLTSVLSQSARTNVFSPPLRFFILVLNMETKAASSSSKLCSQRDDCQLRTCGACSDAKDPEHLHLWTLTTALTQVQSQEWREGRWAWGVLCFPFTLPCESRNRHLIHSARKFKLVGHLEDSNQTSSTYSLIYSYER